MTMKLVAITVVLTLLFALPATVFALGMETFGNAPAVKQTDWAEGVVEVVNLKSRVYSQWVNGNEHFFYRGDARGVNEALAKYAAVKADVRQVILMPGSGKTQTFGGKPVDFDWNLHVPSGIYKAVTKRTHAVLTVYIKARKPVPPRERTKIEEWIRDLDSESFQTREKATLELTKLGRDVKPFLREALKARPGLEMRRRIDGLLQKLPAYDLDDLEIPKGVSLVGGDDRIEKAVDRPGGEDEAKNKLVISKEIATFIKGRASR
jgi:hypothetical protein